MNVNSRTACIIDEAVRKFSKEINFKKCIEELTELSLALQHYQDNKISLDELVSEFADVDITTTKLKILLDIDSVVNETIEYKAEALSEKFEEE